MVFRLEKKTPGYKLSFYSCLSELIAFNLSAVELTPRYMYFLTKQGQFPALRSLVWRISC